MGDISAMATSRLSVPDYVAFDLETTGLSPETDEVLEVAMVRFLGGEPVERWSSLVNPGIPVPLKTLRLTHIDPEELKSSPPMADLLDKVQAFRGDLPLVGHNSGFDAAFLGKHIPGFPGVPLYDTLELSRIAIPGFSSYKLTDLARAMGVAVSEAHRAYDDAEVSGVIFRLVQEEMGEMSRQNRDTVLHLMGTSWVAAGMLSGAPVKTRPVPQAEALVQVSLFGEPDKSLPDEPEEIEEPEEPGDPLEAVILRLLDGASGTRALNVPETAAAAQAAAAAAKHHVHATGKRVLMVGFPKEALPVGIALAGVPQDYVCLARLLEVRRQAAAGAYASLDVEQRRFLAAVCRWAEVTSKGVLTEIQWGSAGYEVAPEIACPPDMTCAHSCPSKSQCFYLASRAGAAAGALLAHATEGRAFGLRDRFDIALVWGSGSLGRSWQSGEHRVDLQALKEALRRDGTIDQVPSLDALMNSAGADLSRGGVASPETLSAASRVARELADATAGLRADRGGAAPGGYPVDPPLLWKGLHTAESAAGTLDEFAEASGTDVARIVEQSYGDDSQRGAILVRRAVWPAKAAVGALFQKAPGVVLLSDLVATAAATEGGRRFLGFGDEIGAPADSMRAAPKTGGADLVLGVLDAGRMVSPHEYARYLSDFIVPLAMEVRKGLLVAFPSRSLLKDTYALVQPTLEAQGIAVYGHGIDGGRRVVEHLAEEDSVVFATTGGGPADGEPVPQCLMLTRVAFAPPNPLDEARRGQVATPSGSFVEVSVRPAALALRSYVEKMVQAGGPRFVVIADPKVLPRRSTWGADFMASFADLTRAVCPAAEILSRLRRQT